MKASISRMLVPYADFTQADSVDVACISPDELRWQSLLQQEVFCQSYLGSKSIVAVVVCCPVVDALQSYGTLEQ